MSAFDRLDDVSFSEGVYRLIHLRREDMLPIMRWRNEQMDVLRQDRPLTEADQEAYFECVVTPSFSQDEPALMLFSFLKNEVPIGYGGLTNIHWQARRAEVSFLLDTDRVADAGLYAAEFAIFLRLLKRVTFTGLALNRLYTETFDTRPLHVKILEESGFAFEGRMRHHAFVRGKTVDSLIHGLLAADYHG